MRQRLLSKLTSNMGGRKQQRHATLIWLRTSMRHGTTPSHKHPLIIIINPLFKHNLKNGKFNGRMMTTSEGDGKGIEQQKHNKSSKMDDNIKKRCDKNLQHETFS